MSEPRFTVETHAHVHNLPTDWCYMYAFYECAVRHEKRLGQEPRYEETRRWDGKAVRGLRLFTLEVLNEARREKETRDNG